MSSLLSDIPVYHRAVGAGAKMRHVVLVDRPATWGGRNKAVNLGLGAESRTLLLAADTTSASREQQAFLDWLLGRARIDAGQYAAQTFWRRLPACLRTLRVDTCTEARQLLIEQPELISSAINSLVIGVTSFFRDASVFNDLARTVVPALAARRDRLRIWSIGCSDGSELYSVAILLAEAGLIRRAELVGTDCRSDAIKQARVGVYDPAALQGADAALVERYFRKESHRMRVIELLRLSVEWRAGDALRQMEPGDWDLILCRNMAMYLKPEASSRLWQNLEGFIRPGGMLILGKAERPVGVRQLSMVAPCIYRRG